jgi:flagellar basal-body rod protein FlgB
MPITDLPILSMLRTRMEWHQERQKVLAENVANSDTPGFRPRDLSQPKFDNAEVAMSSVGLTLTASHHIAGVGGQPSKFRTDGKTHSEVRPGGNAVSLEEEMMKVASNQMDYQAATALYTRSLNLLKTALGKR